MVESYRERLKADRQKRGHKTFKHVLLALVVILIAAACAALAAVIFVRSIHVGWEKPPTTALLAVHQQEIATTPVFAALVSERIGTA